MLTNNEDGVGLPILGSTEIALDTKYRILIPKDMRDRLGQNFALWIGDLGCIYACTAARWTALMAQIQEVPPNSEGRRSYHALCYRYAADNLNWDEQGRIVLPEPLRKAAQIVRDIYLDGQIDHLEIWALSEWEKYNHNLSHYNLSRLMDIERAKTLMGALPRQVNPVEEALRRGVAD